MNRLARSLAPLALVLLAAAAPASADNPPDQAQDFPRGALLGGGYIGTGVPLAAATQTVGVRLAADFTQVNIHAVTEGDCDDGDSIPGSASAYNVPIGDGGKFAGSVPYETSGAGGSRSGTFSYSGKVGANGIASGTARLEMTVRLDGSPEFHCDTGSFKWTARDPLSKPGSGTLRKKAAYFGTRSDSKSVAFRVDRRGQKVASFVFDQGFRSGECSVGEPAVEPSNITLVGLKIKKGKFSAKRRIDRAYSDADVRYEFEVTGEFARARAGGTLVMKVTARRKNGELFSSCVKDDLVWDAER